MVEISEEMVEAGAAGMYGKNWNNPDDEKRPGEKMKDVWRNYARAALVATAPLIETAVRDEIAKSEISRTRDSIRRGARRSEHRFSLSSAKDSDHE